MGGVIIKGTQFLDMNPWVQINVRCPGNCGEFLHWNNHDEVSERKTVLAILDCRFNKDCEYAGFKFTVNLQTGRVEGYERP